VVADLLGDGVEEVDDVLLFALELGAQIVALGGDADRAGVEVALADVDAAEGDEGDGAEVELLGAQDGGVDDVAPGAQAAVGAQGHAAAQVVEHEHLLGFGEAELPRQTGVFDGRDRRGAGAALVAGDEDDVGVGLGHPGGDGADAGFGDELDADAGARVDLLQVVDELGQILDRIDVVVRRRRNQLHAGLGAAEARDEGVDLVAGQLAALAGLGALGHLDFDFLGAGEVFGGDAEAAGGDLLDLGVEPRAVGPAFEAHRILAALAGIRLAADFVHGDGQRLVGLGRDGAERHGGGGEAARMSSIGSTSSSGIGLPSLAG
jgi:hypothetical protein